MSATLSMVLFACTIFSNLDIILARINFEIRIVRKSVRGRLLAYMYTIFNKK